MTENSNNNVYDDFVKNISTIKSKISKKNAYNMTIFFTLLYVFSLFLPWCKAPANINLSDSGISSGWSEMSYMNIIPLLFIIYNIFKNKDIQMKSILISSAASLLIFVYNNIINKSIWNNTESETVRNPDNIFMSTTVSSHTYDVGSDFGVGFWIGFISLVVIILCAVAWSAHFSDEKQS